MFQYTAEDKQRAKALQAQYLQRYEREPVFQHARDTLNLAERRYQSADKQQQQHVPVRQRHKAAKERLRANLASINSKAGASFYNESVPTAPGEQTVRALISVDTVRPVMGEPKTCVRVDLRPHNDASFAARRETLLHDGIELPQDIVKTKQNVGALAKVTIQLRAEVPPADVQQALTFFRGLLEMARAPITLALETAPKGGARSIVATFVVPGEPGKRDAVGDFLEELMRSFGLPWSMRDKLMGEERGMTPELFRLATARLELPESIGEWLRDHGENALASDASWASLLEGMRVSAEVILKDQAARLVQDKIAAGVLEARVPELGALPFLLGSHLVKENSVHLRVAPPELIAAQAVREIGATWRELFKRIGGEVSRSNVRDWVQAQMEAAAASGQGMPPQQSSWVSDDNSNGAGGEDHLSRAEITTLLATTAPEEQLATGIFERSLIGLSAHTIRRAILLQRDFSRLVGGGGKESELLLKAARFVRAQFGALTKIEALTRSGEVTVDIRGVDASLLAWLPKPEQFTPAGIAAIIKPLALATSVPSGDIDGDAPEEFTPPRSEKEASWQWGPFFGPLSKSLMDGPIESSPASSSIPLAALVQLPAQRTATAENPEAASTAWDFPQRTPIVDASAYLRDAFEDFVAVREGQKDSKTALMPAAVAAVAAAAAAASEMPALGAKEEEHDAPRPGELMVTCPTCGARHSTSVQHSCATTATASQNQVVVVQGEKHRPLQRGKKDDDDEDGGKITESQPLLPSPPRQNDGAGAARPSKHNSTGRNSGSSSNNNNSVSPRRPAPNQQRDRLFTRLGGFVIPTDEKALRDIFATFDVDGNGKISKAEFMREYAALEASMGVVLSERDLATKFKLADKNNDGTLSFKEFQLLMVARAKF